MTSKPETSPFTPGQPAPLELFVGRAPQVEALLEHARDAAGGRLKVGFLTGDRGIGKTSLARFATSRFSSRSVVSERDARRAVMSAANVVGHKYFAPQVLDRVQSPRYRSLRRTIPKAAPTGRFKRAESSGRSMRRNARRPTTSCA